MKIGVCSICGGDVIKNGNEITCTQCGSKQKMKVIEMEKQTSEQLLKG